MFSRPIILDKLRHYSIRDFFSLLYGIARVSMLHRTGSSLAFLAIISTQQTPEQVLTTTSFEETLPDTATTLGVMIPIPSGSSLLLASGFEVPASRRGSPLRPDSHMHALDANFVPSETCNPWISFQTLMQCLLFVF